jgi:hypothetical protein
VACDARHGPLAGAAIAPLPHHGHRRYRLDAAFAAHLQVARATRRRFGDDDGDRMILATQPSYPTARACAL